MRERPETQGAMHWSHRQPERVPRGERRYNAKLDAANVRRMRDMRGQGALFRELAARFGVAVKTAEDICKRKRWAHV